MIDFGDIDLDDVFTVGDGQVDWSKVLELRQQIAEIQAIEDPAERLEEAKRWAAELNG
jgi:hypothetical protein